MLHEKLLRLPDVMRQTGLRRAAIYARIREGVFPPPVKIGKRAVAWPESEVQAWIAERVADARERDVEAAPATVTG
jgi:prophage regulatory protein